MAASRCLLAAAAAEAKPNYPGKLLRPPACPAVPPRFREVSHDTSPAALTIFLRKTQLSALQGMCGGCWLRLSLYGSKLLNESLLFGTGAK